MIKFFPILLLLSSPFAKAENHFSSSYSEARDKFVKKARELKEKFKNAQIGEYRVPSRVDDELTTNWLYIPPQNPNSKKPKKLVMMTSAVHGVEGYAGSALQLMFLEEKIEEIDWQQTGLLLIHAVNPYGFKYNRRVTENNVDLNRNFLAHEPGFKDLNSAYPRFNDYLNPEEKASWGFWTNITHYSKAAYYVLKHSKKEFRQAILQGQYSFPKGIFYGGQKQEPQIGPLTELIRRFAESADHIFHFDLHTGYGVAGKLHFFGHTKYNAKVDEAIDDIFHDEKIHAGNHQHFYKTRGDFTKYVGQLLPDKLTISMTFEYGTLDSQTLLGSLKSLKRVRLENQGAHWGYTSKEDEKIIREKFLRLFYPKKKTWREKIMKRSRHVFPKLIHRFQKYSP